jgi:endoglucanase
LGKRAYDARQGIDCSGFNKLLKIDLYCLNMRIYICILIYTSSIFFANTSFSQKTIFFEDQAPEGGFISAYGIGSYVKNSSEVFKNGTSSLQIYLSNEFQYAGAFIVLPKPKDFSANREKKFLSFWVKGKTGAEKIDIFLKDTYKKGGDYDLMVQRKIENYIKITDQWQQVVIPLSDFSDQGVNWDKPPKDEIPHNGKFDWAEVNTIIFGKSESPTCEFFIDDVIIASPNSEELPHLITPLNSDRPKVDFSRAESVSFSASFDMLVNWTITISDNHHSGKKVMTGKSLKIQEEWDGSTDKYYFREGLCSAKLTATDVEGREIKLSPDISKITMVVTAAHSSKIKVNQVGYLPHAKKYAYVSEPDLLMSSVFKVKEEKTGKVKFSGSIQEPIFDKDVNENVSKMDFSKLSEPGRYYIEISNTGRSYSFTIHDSVFRKAFNDSYRAFYYQRCGEDLEEKFAGKWTHKACHTKDAFIYDGLNDSGIIKGQHINSIGGWHDAGDYGKKVVPASVSIYYMLKLFEYFPVKVKMENLNTPPVSTEMPDVLKETKFELDWMLTMQREDGAVYALITSSDFFLGAMPEEDNLTRYFVPVSSCATADFAATMAMAYTNYKNLNRDFAERCLKASELAWEYLEKNPEIFPKGGYKDPPGINNTGTYYDTDDKDERFWAASELYAATGKEIYNTYVKKNYTDWSPTIGSFPPGWIHTQVFGMLTYLLNEKGDKAIRERIKEDFIKHVNQKLERISSSGYGVCLTTSDYYWGSNYGLASYGTMLIIAHKITHEDRYKEAALSQLNYLLGGNSLDLCFISGQGTKSPKKFWQAANKYDNIVDPIPGFMPSGPNKNLNDPALTAYQKKYNLPPAKCYIDDYESYSCNEITILNNGPLVFLIGYFLE